MITQAQLEAMDDEELEITLDKLTPELEKGGWKPTAVFKYCSNPNDILPWVIKYKIGLWFDDKLGLWFGNQTCVSDDGEYLCDKFENDIPGYSYGRVATTVIILLLLEKEE